LGVVLFSKTLGKKKKTKERGRESNRKVTSVGEDVCNWGERKGRSSDR
jgi:hypothetical protein